LIHSLLLKNKVVFIGGVLAIHGRYFLSPWRYQVHRGTGVAAVLGRGGRIAAFERLMKEGVVLLLMGDVFV
jgi:hypothetical protein